MPTITDSIQFFGAMSGGFEEILQFAAQILNATATIDSHSANVGTDSCAAMLNRIRIDADQTQRACHEAIAVIDGNLQNLQRVL